MGSCRFWRCEWTFQVQNQWDATTNWYYCYWVTATATTAFRLLLVWLFLELLSMLLELSWSCYSSPYYHLLNTHYIPTAASYQHRLRLLLLLRWRRRLLLRIRLRLFPLVVLQLNQLLSCCDSLTIILFLPDMVNHSTEVQLNFRCYLMSGWHARESGSPQSSLSEWLQRNLAGNMELEYGWQNPRSAWSTKTQKWQNKSARPSFRMLSCLKHMWRIIRTRREWRPGVETHTTCAKHHWPILNSCLFRCLGGWILISCRLFLIHVTLSCHCIGQVCAHGD